MKGYENFKVSIPTTGIDLQLALDRSPAPSASGCKLAALADIALGNDVPHAIGLIPSVHCDEPQVEASKTPLHESAADTVQHSAAAPAVFHRHQPPPPPPPLPLQPPSTSRPPAFKSRTDRKPIGNKLGFNQRKKKPLPKSRKSQQRAQQYKQPAANLFEFDDSLDSYGSSVCTTNQHAVADVRSSTASTSTVGISQTGADHHDDSHASSYSDRDDFNYDNSPSESNTSDAMSCVTKRSAKSINTAQKKCLIMGRIFKGVKRPEVAKDVVVVEKTAKEVKKPIPKQELDKMFDSLREAPATSTSGAAHQSEHLNETADAEDNDVPIDDDDEEDEEVQPEKPAPFAAKSSKSNASKSGASAKSAPISKSSDRQRSRKGGRNIANIEEECGMSMDKIYDIMGVGQRKTQRRCTTNKQHTFAETWSSDEYEDFHSTSDIMALIQEAEKKANRQMKQQQASKRNSNGGNGASAAVAAAELDKPKKTEPKRRSEPKAAVDKSAKSKPRPSIAAVPKPKKTTTFVGLDDADDESNNTDNDNGCADAAAAESEPEFESMNKRSVKRPAGISHRRKTISCREDGNSVKPAKAPKKRPALPPSPALLHPSNHVDSVVASTSGTASAPKPSSKPLARRKRVASEMLYYWSSSSDEDFGRIKPRETFNDDNLEQHGWIVGDSHKKLVTLLAHAKGKKVEDCGVKETAHKKK